jgi:exopolysaccharide biosynthesis protein
MSKLRFIILLLILSISYTNIIQSKTKAKPKAKSGVTKSAKKKSLSKSKKKKRGRRSSLKYSSGIINGNFDMVLQKDTLIQNGITYKNILFGKRKTKISANIIEVDLSNKNLSVEVLKAKNNFSELDKLQEIIRFSDSTSNKYTVGAVNASFWRAVKNNPIGACVIDGSIIELNPYKEWSSLFIDDKGLPYIDNFKMSGIVKLHDGKIVRISNMNRRRDSTGVVLYNRFGGDVIPHISNAAIDKIVANAYSEVESDSTLFTGDSTEIEFSYEDFEKKIIENIRNQQLESSISKAVIEFIDKPTINQKFRAVVNYIDTGSVKIRHNQGVLSFGFYLPPDLVVYTGDTLEFLFETNIFPDKKFVYACAATPRLVRAGVAAQEANREGSRSRRFINGQLGRTSIGYNMSKNKFYLVTIDHANSSIGKKGASLGELAQVMKQIGCYDAMNLDGGGSSVMVIDGKNVMSRNPDASRRISVGIGVRVCK